MKRQKRDRMERAQSQGYKAGLNGRSTDSCPTNRWMLALIGLVVGAMPGKIDTLVSTNKITQSTYEIKPQLLGLLLFLT